MQKAEEYVSRYPKRECKQFGRDKSTQYFSDIKSRHGGIEQPYIKDNHGDPRNPINGRINGLFFNATVDSRTGDLPTSSIYGELRYTLPPSEVIKVAPNLYFADVYCTGRPHYVQLVLTRDGSIADDFCKAHLIKLDLYQNPFLDKQTNSYTSLYFSMQSAEPRDKLYVPSGTGLWIEVLVAGSTVNLDNKCFQKVAMTGMRSGGSVGLRKNSGCSTCNITTAASVTFPHYLFGFQY